MDYNCPNKLISSQTKVDPDKFIVSSRGTTYCEVCGSEFYDLYAKMCNLEKIKVHIDRSLYLIIEKNKRDSSFYCENGREVKLGLNVFPNLAKPISEYGEFDRIVSQADTGICTQGLYRVAPMQDIGMCIRSAEKGYICNVTIPDDAYVRLDHRYIFTDKVDVTFIQPLTTKFTDWDWDVVSVRKKGGAVIEQIPPLKSKK